MSPEEIKLLAKKIIFEGLVTANENFKILEDGSIEAKKGKFSGHIEAESGSFKGDVYLGSGSKVIGGDGLLTNLCFSSSGKYHNYDLLGFNVLSNGTTGGMEYGYADIELDVDIPKNFKVISAYISLYHTPAYWAYYDSSSHETYGYSRNLKIYKASSLSNYSFYMTYASEYQFGSNDIQLSEITNAFGNVTYTPTNTTGNGIEIKNSINIKDFLSTGSNKLVIRTSDAIPTNNEGACCIKTGMARAVINIIGYMSG